MSAWGDIEAAQKTADKPAGNDGEGQYPQYPQPCKRCAGLAPAHFLTCPVLKLPRRENEDGARAE